MVERWCGLVASMPSPAQRHAAGFVAKINDNSHSLPHLGRRGEKGKEAATLSLSLLAATLSRHCRASPSSVSLFLHGKIVFTCCPRGRRGVAPRNEAEAITLPASRQLFPVCRSLPLAAVARLAPLPLLASYCLHLERKIEVRRREKARWSKGDSEGRGDTWAPPLFNYFLCN